MWPRDNLKEYLREKDKVRDKSSGSNDDISPNEYACYH